MTFWAEKRKAARPVPGLFLELREAKEAGAGEDHEGPRGVNLSLSPKAAKRRWKGLGTRDPFYSKIPAQDPGERGAGAENVPCLVMPGDCGSSQVRGSRRECAP